MTNKLYAIAKKATFYFIIIATLTIATRIETSAQTANKISDKDMKAINAYVKRTYGSKYRIRIIKGGTEDRNIVNRKDKHVIYIEQFKTVSKGKNGIITAGKCKGCIAGYAAKQRKGSKVTTYLLYGPETNKLDDIQAVITKGKVK